jgi:hypothetical protein
MEHTAPKPEISKHREELEITKLSASINLKFISETSSDMLVMGYLGR